MHYLRIYVKVIESCKLSNSIFENIGYVQHCFHCGNRIVSNAQSRVEKCNSCSAAFKSAGWLWTGRMYDKDFVQEMMAETLQRQGSNGNYQVKCISKEDTKLSTMENKIHNRKQKNLQRLFSTCISECDDIPYYFTTDEIASRLKIGPPSLATIIESLYKAGFRTSQTGLNTTGFKTDANINEIMTLFRA
jgi:tRNA (guanine26-N2/guanine27-N2)-dimethyltransferase